MSASQGLTTLKRVKNNIKELRVTERRENHKPPKVFIFSAHKMMHSKSLYIFIAGTNCTSFFSHCSVLH